MNACGSGWTGSQINVEVPNLAEEVVLVRIPIVSTIVIRITVDDSNAYERWQSFDSGERRSITDKLGVVQLDDRLADSVCTLGKVYDGRSDSTRVTTLATSISISNGTIDGISIVRGAVTVIKVSKMI